MSEKISSWYDEWKIVYKKRYRALYNNMSLFRCAMLQELDAKRRYSAMHVSDLFAGWRGAEKSYVGLSWECIDWFALWIVFLCSYCKRVLSLWLRFWFLKGFARTSRAAHKQQAGGRSRGENILKLVHRLCLARIT